MTVRPVLTDPNKELRAPSEKLSASEVVSDETKTLVEDLIQTMHVENGIGIAAPQIGVHKRVIIVDRGTGPEAYVNPKIVSSSLRKVESEEGCLSVPGIYGMVTRHKKVKVKAQKLDGTTVTLKEEGLPAIIFQHEIDHLDGVLFIDKVTRYTSPPKM